MMNKIVVKGEQDVRSNNMSTLETFYTIRDEAAKTKGYEMVKINGNYYTKDQMNATLQLLGDIAVSSKK